jgi:hypothetical protein
MHDEHRELLLGSLSVAGRAVLDSFYRAGLLHRADAGSPIDTAPWATNQHRTLAA